MNDPGAVPSDVRLPGRYRVREVLGTGGMATVYLADDLVANREVAVKVLKPSLAGAVGTDRFLREIRLVGNLRHRNIVALLDAGEADGVPYFVMPRIDGESLRRRLDRDRQLPFDDVARIVRALADALQAAHGEGVVHRDVKPENVLLSRDDVFLADFGIARALSSAADERLTDSGLAIGTAGYMSPEQAAGERDIDARSDIYSLGCVAFEMLAGEPPYTGPSAQAVVAKQLSLPVPSLAVVRDTIPIEVDRVIRKALAKVPADRYQMVTAFADALATALGSPGPARLTRLPGARLARVAVGAVVVAALLVLGREGVARMRGPVASLQPADTLRYVVLPFTHTRAAANDAKHDERIVREALLRWSGISVVDDGKVRDAVGNRAGGLTGAQASRLARELRSGRYVRGDVSSAGDQRELRLRLFNALGRDSLLAEATVRLTSEGRDSRTFIGSTIDSLLLRDLWRDNIDASRGTRSLPARQAYERGREAIAAWKLDHAVRGFQDATRLDPTYTEAHLWNALAAMWSARSPAQWSIAADQAVLGAARLSEREKAFARAVQAHARRDLATACPIWRGWTQRDSLDAIAWYGSAHCLAADDIVLRDPASPSGWRFRTSYRRALADYEHAFRLQPSMLASLGGNAFEALGGLFKTGTTLLRRGRALAPSEQTFSASMEWASDSLAFVPYPLGTGALAAHTYRRLDAMNEAVRQQRALVRAVASSWVSAFPDSPDAWQALALSLAALGESSALDTLERARSLAKTLEERGRVAGTVIAMQTAFALRDGDTTRLRSARVLADSLLAHAVGNVDSDAVLLTSLAALTGRGLLAARLARSQAVAEAFAVPDALRAGAAPLLVLASLGGPADSLRALERQVADLIARGVSPSKRTDRRLEFLARAASMAFPFHRFDTIHDLARDGDALVVLQVRRLRGDSIGVRRGLAEFRQARRGVLPEHLAIDALAPEAALLWSLGDAAAVVGWLGPTLHVLPQVQPGLLSSPVRAGTLTPALLLRARAADKLGDRVEARRWATAVAILWSHADPFLQPLVKEAQRIAQ